MTGASSRVMSSGRTFAKAFLSRRRTIALAIAVMVILRLVTEWVALVSAYGVGFPHLVARTPSVLYAVWNQWDTGYYVSIAQHWYPGHHLGPGQVSDAIAFAPAYPAAMAIVEWIFGGSYVLAGLTVSAISFVLSCVGLVELADGDLSRSRRGTALAMLAAFPTAFFLLASYPESLALAALVWSFVAARRRHWLVAGLLVALAALTKYYLILAVIPLVMECIQTERQHGRRLLSPGLIARGSLLAVPPVGAFAGWMIYQQVHIGSALAFAHAQSAHWHRHFAAPWTMVANTTRILVHLQFLDTATASLTELFDAVSVVLLALAAIYAFVRIRPSYGVLLGLIWCVFCFQTSLLSVTREVLVLFPFFLVLADWVADHPWLERLAFALFVPCGYLLVERFVTMRFAG